VWGHPTEPGGGPSGKLASVAARKKGSGSTHGPVPAIEQTIKHRVCQTILSVNLDCSTHNDTLHPGDSVDEHSNAINNRHAESRFGPRFPYAEIHFQPFPTALTPAPHHHGRLCKERASRAHQGRREQACVVFLACRPALTQL
jgi:hypothetical protein